MLAILLLCFLVFLISELRLFEGKISVLTIHILLLSKMQCIRWYIAFPKIMSKAGGVVYLVEYCSCHEFY